MLCIHHAPATFSLTITFPGDQIAISNMPIEKEEGNEWKTVKFQATPIMSTYLLAFVIGEFDMLDSTAAK